MVKMTKKRLEDVSLVVSVCKAYQEKIGITQEDVAKSFRISPDAVRRCIYEAGEKNWISFQILDSIRRKVHNQQNMHVKTNVSDRWYEKLYSARHKYILNHLTVEFATKVVQTYNKNASSRKVHEMVGLSEEEMKDVLVKASIERLISDEDFQTMCDVSLYRGWDESDIAFIIMARDDYPYLEGEIKERKRLLETYDEVFSDADEAPSKEELQCEIKEREARLNQIKLFIEKIQE